MNYTIKVIRPAVVEPITIDEAHAQLRLRFGADAEHVAMLIGVARDRVEKFCNRYFTEQDIRVSFFDIDSSRIALPIPDVGSIIAVSLIGKNGEEEAVSYQFIEGKNEILLGDDVSPGDTVAVELTTAVPKEFGGAKMAMLMILTDLYELRTESVSGFSVVDNPAVMSLMYPYRVNIGV